MYWNERYCKEMYLSFMWVIQSVVTLTLADRTGCHRQVILWRVHGPSASCGMGLWIGTMDQCFRSHIGLDQPDL